MNFFGFKGTVQSVVFVIDISGSMVSGKKDADSYDRLEHEVVKAVNGLAPQAKFDVLVFSRTVPANSPHEDSIAAGAAAIQQMGTAGNFNVVHSEDATLFTDAGLRPYEVIVLLNTDGEGVLTPVQRNAFERWFQRGNGLVGIHSQTNADRNLQWMTDMNGGAPYLETHVDRQV